MILLVVCTLIIWSVIGLGIWTAVATSSGWVFSDTGFEFLTPSWIYGHFRVNWFGCCILFCIFNTVCPVLSFGYWFYRLCTVGRKSEKVEVDV